MFLEKKTMWKKQTGKHFGKEFRNDFEISFESDTIGGRSNLGDLIRLGDCWVIRLGT